MTDVRNMTGADLRTEFEALWAKLDVVPEATYDVEASDEDRDRFHSLAAELHHRRVTERVEEQEKQTEKAG